MKLIIQIPCFNEEGTLAQTLSELPKDVPGFDVVETLIIDDGSTDGTAEVATSCGATHVIRHSTNKGLARAFMTGLNFALRKGADVIVTTDADNQYRGEDVLTLVNPIMEHRADFVIGTRPIRDIESFSVVKRSLQFLGTAIVRVFSGTQVEDAPSGFRAFNRETAMKLHVFSDYTYTLETIIQAGEAGIVVESVPIRVNQVTRPSRLIHRQSTYVIKNAITMLRIFALYRPMQFFGIIGVVLAGLGLLIGIRFLIYFYLGLGDGHVQSLILAGLLIGLGFQTLLVAIVADLLAANRKILEEVRLDVRRRMNPDSKK